MNGPGFGALPSVGDGPLDQAEARYECICPGVGCCDCFGQVDLCDCKTTTDAPEAA